MSTPDRPTHLDYPSPRIPTSTQFDGPSHTFPSPPRSFRLPIPGQLDPLRPHSTTRPLPPTDLFASTNRACPTRPDYPGLLVSAPSDYPPQGLSLATRPDMPAQPNPLRPQSDYPSRVVPPTLPATPTVPPSSYRTSPPQPDSPCRTRPRQLDYPHLPPALDSPNLFFPLHVIPTTLPRPLSDPTQSTHRTCPPQFDFPYPSCSQLQPTRLPLPLLLSLQPTRLPNPGLIYLSPQSTSPSRICPPPDSLRLPDPRQPRTARPHPLPSDCPPQRQPNRSQLDYPALPRSDIPTHPVATSSRPTDPLSIPNRHIPTTLVSPARLRSPRLSAPALLHPSPTALPGPFSLRLDPPRHAMATRTFPPRPIATSPPEPRRLISVRQPSPSLLIPSRLPIPSLRHFNPVHVDCPTPPSNTSARVPTDHPPRVIPSTHRAGPTTLPRPSHYIPARAVPTFRASPYLPLAPIRRPYPSRLRLSPSPTSLASPFLSTRPF